MDDNDEEGSEDGRETAPMSEYGQREVLVGFGVLLVGAIVAFGIPIALTL